MEGDPRSTELNADSMPWQAHTRATSDHNQSWPWDTFKFKFLREKILRSEFCTIKLMSDFHYPIWAPSSSPIRLNSYHLRYIFRNTEQHQKPFRADLNLKHYVLAGCSPGTAHTRSTFLSLKLPLTYWITFRLLFQNPIIHHVFTGGNQCWTYLLLSRFLLLPFYFAALVKDLGSVSSSHREASSSMFCISSSQ